MFEYRHIQTKNILVKGLRYEIYFGTFLFITTLLGDENMSIYDIEVKDIDGKVLL